MAEGEMGFHRIHIMVTGHVQNVGFRAFVQQIGNRMDVTGWVRNIGNAQVEVIAEGVDTQLNQFTALVTKGPPGSRVDQVSDEKLQATHEFSKFSIRSSR